MEVVIGILSITTVALAITAFRLMKRIESMEDYVNEVEKSNDKTLLLQETLQKLRKELSLKNTRIEDLEKLNKQLESVKVSQGAVFMKNSNLNDMM